MAYRILSLDGGGSWALIQVRALIDLYGGGTTGHQVLQDFDMVAANSGGSVVLGGLVENVSLDTLKGYFEDDRLRRSIFSPTSSLADQALEALIGLGPKYSAEAKLTALQRILANTGSLPLDGITTGLRRSGSANDVRLLIVGFDYDRTRAVFFRSTESDGGYGKGNASTVTLADAIHASSNAPVNYFDGPATFPDNPTLRYWDGAIAGCNNPVLTAVTEAITIGISPDEIVALTLGTGNVCLAPPDSGNPPFVRSQEPPSLMRDLKKIAGSILADPPDAATFIAHVMVEGGKGVNASLSRIVRMNPLVSPKWDQATKQWISPNGLTAAQFNYLVVLDMDAIEDHQVDAIKQFADLWIAGNVTNQPIRMDSKTLACELGYETYGAAKRAWNAIK